MAPTAARLQSAHEPPPATVQRASVIRDGNSASSEISVRFASRGEARGGEGKTAEDEEQQAAGRGTYVPADAAVTAMSDNAEPAKT